MNCYAKHDSGLICENVAGHDDLVPPPNLDLDNTNALHFAILPNGEKVEWIRHHCALFRLPQQKPDDTIDWTPDQFKHCGAIRPCGSAKCNLYPGHEGWHRDRQPGWERTWLLPESWIEPPMMSAMVRNDEPISERSEALLICWICRDDEPIEDDGEGDRYHVCDECRRRRES